MTNLDKRKVYQADWYRKNRDRVLAKQAAYNQRNKSRRAAQQAAWRKKNRKRIAAEHAGYYQKNKERIAAYRARNKEHLATQRAAYRMKNKERFAASMRKYVLSFRIRFYDIYGLKKKGHEHGVCTCCKEADLMLFGTISHIDGSGKQHRESVNNDGVKLLKQALTMYDPAKFAAECFNCNMGAVRNGGICPHKTKEPRQ